MVWAWRRFETWLIPYKQWILERPWWMLCGLGIGAVMVMPTLLIGPLLVLVALFFATRTAIHEWRLASRQKHLV